MKNILIFCLITLVNLNTHATPQGTIFTYQGKLIQNNSPANGSYDIYVTLHTDALNGTLIDNNSFLLVNVVDGVFSVDLNFGNTPFMGEERWIELEVRSISELNYTKLSPRQLISNAPYAIHSQFIGSNGVDTFAVQNGAITEQKIADNSITTNKIVVGAVTEQKIANNSITSDKITTGAVTNSKIANNAVGTLNIMNQSVFGVDLANNTITNTQLATDTISHTEIGTSAVRSDEILDGTILAADINSSSVQQRISGTCAAGSSIASILANGTVTCENDDVGITGWGLTGNAGTNPAMNFIGTTDSTDFLIKVDNIDSMRITNHSNIALGRGSIINTQSFFSVISGGLSNVIDGTTDSYYNTISGGANNKITGFGSNYSSIIGGRLNIIDGSKSAITGGESNVITGNYSTIAGGNLNKINSKFSFVSGHGSKALHDGSWVWNDYSDANTNNSFETTAVNQFLIRAEGGFGLGTNAPASPMHIKGDGKTYGALVDEVVMTVEPKDTLGDVSIAINKLDANKESALAFTINKVPEFDIRNVSGGALDFNSYQAGTAQFMMRINDSGTNRIDFNTNLEPQSDNVFDIGSANYRFAAVHATNIISTNIISTNIDSTNPVNVTSDRRLKDNINDIHYGLSEILNLKPVSYQLINGGNNKKHLGLIAQEVEMLIPEIVNKANDEKQTRSMRYTELVPVLIKAIQEQQVLIDHQSEQINVLIETNKLLLKHINIK